MLSEDDEEKDTDDNDCDSEHNTDENDEETSNSDLSSFCMINVVNFVKNDFTKAQGVY
jgi:hypothetical protein